MHNYEHHSLSLSAHMYFDYHSCICIYIQWQMLDAMMILLALTVLVHMYLMEILAVHYLVMVHIMMNLVVRLANHVSTGLHQQRSLLSRLITSSSAYCCNQSDVFVTNCIY